ncbi:MAG: M23 family metallopeptidase [Gammaproteobacteria bacterium]|nr:M23 family metallopeptidase [Gammaproteobacteria bacterium]
MNIILFTRRQGQVWNVEINPVMLIGAILACLALAIGAVLYTGIRIGADELAYVAEWKDDVRQKQAEIQTIRHTAQADLDALTLRIGQLQAQMLRLNALGERLVSQGNLGTGEFDFASQPAMGGPQDAMPGKSVPFNDFIGMLDDLDHEMTDREQQLSVLESVLSSRSLSERVMPSGRPITDGWLSSRFGKRNDPFTGKREYHKGLDFAGKKGSDVVAVGDGVISWSGKRSGYGNLVEINHGNGYATRYGHNQRNLVKVGDTVKKGELIALMGSSGRSTGPHVHFEVLRNGKAVNPSRYIGK